MKGAKIYTNEETERILAGSRDNKINLDISELKKEQQETNKLLGNLAVSHNGKMYFLNKDKIWIEA